MQAFWSDDRKAIVVIGCKTAKKYEVEYENITYEKAIKITTNQCGYVEVVGTANEPLPPNEDINVGSKKLNLHSITEIQSAERPYCTKKGSSKGQGGEYSMNNIPQANQTFSYKGDLYVYGFSPKEKVKVSYKVTGNKKRKIKAAKGGIIVLRDSKSFPLSNDMRITVGGVNMQPLQEDAI